MPPTPGESREEWITREALEMAPSERSDLLETACAGDASLLQRVVELLRKKEAKAAEKGTVVDVNALRQRVEAGLLAEPEPGNPPGDPGAQLAGEERPGTIIGRYRLLEKIGEGGFGAVYVAEQKEPVRRRVALKIIKLGMDTRQVVARFEAERQALAMMDHPNIAKVLEAGATQSGRPYFVMELVRGIAITRYCDENNLPTEKRLQLFNQTCAAIQHAHQKGIIHRDIKPSNILVTLHDGVPVPKVIDFGIAKATQGELINNTVYTQFQQFIGTPAYVSPEQAEMSGLDIDTRSDMYSLGILLYELLTGKTPFDSKRLLEAGLDQMRRIIREEEPLRPSTRLSMMSAEEQRTMAARRGSTPLELIHRLRGDLDCIVTKCLEKDRLRRYDTPQDLALDIERHLAARPIAARAPKVLYRFGRLIRRNQRAVTVAGATAIFTLVGLVVTMLVLRGPVSRVLEVPPPKSLPANVQLLGAGPVLSLIYTGAPPVAAAGKLAPELQFQIQARRRGAAGFSNLQDGDTLASRVDDYLLVARALSEGYLYVFQVDALGKRQWLFPENQTFEWSSGANPVKPRHFLQMPSAAKKAFYLDKTAGIEHIYVVFSAGRWPELEATLSRPLPSAPAGPAVAVVQVPNGLLSRGIEGTHNSEGATNVVGLRPADAVQNSHTYYELAVGGQRFEATGAFLVIERWFRHINDTEVK
jgi:hypothetical protein